MCVGSDECATTIWIVGGVQNSGRLGGRGTTYCDQDLPRSSPGIGSSARPRTVSGQCMARAPGPLVRFIRHISTLEMASQLRVQGLNGDKLLGQYTKTVLYFVHVVPRFHCLHCSHVRQQFVEHRLFETPGGRKAFRAKQISTVFQAWRRG